MTLSAVHTIPPGDHQRLRICLALVGPRVVPTSWAVQAMNIQLPPNAQQSLFAFANNDLDLARNLAIKDWLAAPLDLQADWLALISPENHVRGDAIAACIAADDPISRIGGSYVIHRDALASQTPPWFEVDGWKGVSETVRDDLIASDIFAPPPADAPKPVDPDGAKKTIVICVPTLGQTTLDWTVSAIMLQGPMACSGVAAVAIGYEVGEARQRLVDTVLSMDPRPEFMLFFGDDNIPPHDGLQMLLDTARRMDEPCVSGLYHIKHYPPTQAIMWRNDRPGPLIAGRDFELGEAVRVDGCGLDFCLFRTEALAAMPPLKFRTVVEWMPGRGMLMQTEDAFFFDRWREIHGKGPIVDTRCRVGHLDARTGGIY